ncbi:MAG: flagellar basal body protein [Rhodospirillales bacterium]|nr:flagellar basal body protein [Rhodospirillales bacterium]
MLSGMLNSAVSGVNASALSVAVAANNIVNVSTQGYQRSEVVYQTLSTRQSGTSYNAGGVLASPRQLTDAQELSSTDLGTEFVALISAQTAYSASLKVLAAGEELSRSILSIRA